MNDNYLILYASCIPVKGFTQCVIYDLQRCTYFSIPHSLFELLQENNQKLNIREIEKTFSQEDRETLKEYVEFLLEKELAFGCSDPDLFPLMPLVWDSPSLITNAVVCLNEKTMPRLSAIVNKLDSLGVQCVELQFTVALTDTLLFKVLDSFHESAICSLEVLCTKKSVKAINYNSLILMYPRVTKVTMYESEEYNKSIKDGISFELINARYKPDLCGTISHKSLLFSIPFFMEAQFYNVCLNRKICIDEKGDVKNCPMSDIKFGNILSDSIDLKELASSENFNFATKIKKDNIEVCKICEFRYACPDCRICRHNSSYTSAPAKCQYNPFIGRWKGENDFISVLDMGKYDSDGKFIFDETKLITSNI